MSGERRADYAKRFQAERDGMMITAEQSTIGALLLAPEKLDETSLNGDDFLRREHSLIFHAITALRRDRKHVDIVTVTEFLSRDGDIDAAGGLSYIASLANNTPSASNIGSYAQIVRSAAVGRRSRGLMDEAMQEMMSGDPSQVIHKLIGELMRLTDLGGSEHECSIRDAVTLAIDRMDYIHQNPGLIGITTGIESLDSITGGFQNGDFYAIGGRPAMGKTALLLNFASAAGKKGHSAGIISAEQPRIQIAQRMIGIVGKVMSSRMRTGKLDDEDWPKITSGSGELSMMKLRINDRAGINITDLIRQARRWRHDHKVEIIYVDYLQLIKGSDPRAKRNEQVGEVAMELKQLARELDLPVVSLAQVNRDVEKRENKRPGMADLSDSSEIEKSADAIMTLYRDEVYNRHSEKPGIAEIVMCKNRHGPIGRAYARWEKHFMAFEEMRKEDELSMDDVDKRAGGMEA